MEFNDTSGKLVINVERDFWKSTSLTLIVVFIITTILQLLALIVTCVYYRRRITGLLTVKQDLKMQSKKDTRHNNRESTANNILRYVMNPTRFKEADKYIYDYATSAELGIPQQDISEESKVTLEGERSRTNGKSKTQETTLTIPIQGEARAKICKEPGKIKQKTPKQRQNIAQNKEHVQKGRRNSDIEIDGATKTSDNMKQPQKYKGTALMNESVPGITISKLKNIKSHSIATRDLGKVKQDNKSCIPRNICDEKETDNAMQDATYENYREYSNVEYGAQTEVEDQHVYMNFKSEKEKTPQTTVKRKTVVSNDNPEELNNRNSNGSDGSTESESSGESCVSVNSTLHETNFTQNIVFKIANLHGNIGLGSGISIFVKN